MKGTSMGLFSRRKETGGKSQLLTATSEDLRRLGTTAFGGDSVYPPGLSALSTVELDGYAMAFAAASDYAETGSATRTEAEDLFLNELASAAESGGGWGYAGAIFVGWNCIGISRDNRYRSVVNLGLDHIRRDGVAYTVPPPFAIEIWTEAYGYEGAHPKGWPSPLEDLPQPPPGLAAGVKELDPGECRPLAQAPANPQNTIYAERREGGLIQAVVEGPDPETSVTRRWDWPGLYANDYPEFLKALGDRIVTHTLWASAELIPYIPCRVKTREQMRIEASKNVLA